MLAQCNDMGSQKQQQKSERCDDGRGSKCKKDLSTIAGFEDGESRSRPKECGWPLEAGDGPKLTASKEAGTQPYVRKEVNPGTTWISKHPVLP